MILTAQHLQHLNLARYVFHLRARSNAILPPFLGSTLRGAFGHALKQVACSIPHGDCRRCLLVERCAYPRIFETSQHKANGLLANGQAAPRPFIFVPPAPGPPQGVHARDDLLRWRMGVSAGSSLSFGLTLIGDAIDDLPYVIYAIDLMARRGFGAERAQFELERVDVVGSDSSSQLVYRPGMGNVRLHPEHKLSLGTLVEYRMAQLSATQVHAVAAAANGGRWVRTRQDLTVRFLTPTRLRIKGELLETPSFSQLVSSLSVRVAMVVEGSRGDALNYDYKGMVEKAKEATAYNSTLRIISLERVTNRHQGKLSLDGFMGQVTFSHPEISDFLPLLAAGEILNVGSATAFGLGKYALATT